jgi:(2Fe-2S) ferredoxin
MSFPQPAFYLFKCQFQAPPGHPKPSCVNASNADLFGYLSQKVMQKGLMATVMPVQSACLNRCQMGPVMLVEPGHHLYVGLTKEKIDRIVDEHVIEGKPVEEFLIPEEFWGEAISPKEAMKMAGINP